MKIIIRHILTEFIKPFLASCFIFLLLFNLSEGFRVFNMDGKVADGLKYLPSYLFYQSPMWLIQILPMSLLLGFLFSYSGLAHNNEITAIKAGGISLNKIFLPIIFMAFLISCLVIFANENIVAFSNKKSHEIYKTKIRGDILLEQKIFSDINYLGKNNTKYLIKSFNTENNKMYKVNIDTFDGIVLTKQIYAKFATFKEGTTWTFEEGIIRNFDKNNQFVLQEEYFQTKDIDILETPDSFKIEKIEIEQMNIKQLKKTIQKLKNNSLPFHRELTDMYHKIAFAFSSLIVILIGIAFASSNIKNNKIISFAISLVISFMYWGISSIFISLGSNAVLNPMLAAWATNILFILVSLGFMTKMKL